MLKFEDYKLLQNVFRHFLFSMQRKESNLLDFLQLENGFQRVFYFCLFTQFPTLTKTSIKLFKLPPQVLQLNVSCRKYEVP
mmetsp:Transcript_35579/g.82664  ORF Transcript_35579/g.82664 Transcript_35579/m.82664 type:complete len:81 (+) Transcript_35579:1970-2212(+)